MLEWNSVFTWHVLCSLTKLIHAEPELKEVCQDKISMNNVTDNDILPPSGCGKITGRAVTKPKHVYSLQSISQITVLYGLLGKL